MNAQPIIAWINCYGAWDPSLRHPIETIGYDQYLTAVVAALAPLKDRVEQIYISGGMLDEAGRTECATVKPELTRRLRLAGIEVPIVTDEDSVTSVEIAKKFVTTVLAHYPNHIPLLFVDAVRAEVNNYVVDHYFTEAGKPLASTRTVVVPLPRLDIHPNSTPEVQQAKLAEMKEKGIEVIDRQISEKRRVQKNT
jgi:hypothetical protein